MAESDIIGGGFRDLWDTVVSCTNVPERTPVESFIETECQLPVSQLKLIVVDPVWRKMATTIMIIDVEAEVTKAARLSFMLC